MLVRKRPLSLIMKVWTKQRNDELVFRSVESFVTVDINALNESNGNKMALSNDIQFVQFLFAV